jgi:hypothetical protein
MCVVSMIGDHYNDKWNQPPYNEFFKKIFNEPVQPYNPLGKEVGVTKEQFEALKKEVEEMKQLLIRAKIYDEKNNEPNCEIEDKIKLLKVIAEKMGVDLSEVFK